MDNYVKEIRTRLKLSQPQMAEKMGCGVTSTRRYEYNNTLPENKAVLNNLRKLAKQAGVELTETSQ